MTPNEEHLDTSLMVIPTGDLNGVLNLLQLQKGQIDLLAQNQEQIKLQLLRMNILIEKVLDTMKDNASLLNAKVDDIAASGGSTGVLNSITLPIPVEDEDQLKRLESDAKNVEFTHQFLSKFGAIFGKGSGGGGGTIALQLIYQFFTKEFLIKCCWTG